MTWRRHNCTAFAMAIRMGKRSLDGSGDDEGECCYDNKIAGPPATAGEGADAHHDI